MNSYTVNFLSEKEIEQQKTAFNDLIKDLGNFEDEEIRAILSQRQKVNTDEELPLEIKNKLISKLN